MNMNGMMQKRGHNCYSVLYLTGLLISLQIRLSQSAPKDVEDSLCPGTSTYTRHSGNIFSFLGERCTTENDAYVLGAMYYNYSSSGKYFDKGSMEERWKDFAYLDASPYDRLDNPTPPPTTAPSCIFNERLASQQSPSGMDIKVGLSCNPFDLSYCRREYDDALSLKDYCDCNYLYSIKEKTKTGRIQCVARAGVPCKFNQSASVIDPFLRIPQSIECHSSLICKDHRQVYQRKMYKKVFHGFGINPIVHEYMIENALGFCDCNSSIYTINVLNECIKADALMLYPTVHRLLLLFSMLLLLFTMF